MISYFYIPPISLIAEKETFLVVDQLGGKYRLGKDMLIAALIAAGEKVDFDLLSHTLRDEFDIDNGQELLEDLIQSKFLTETKYKRKESFHYDAVARRIFKEKAEEGNLLNIGTVTIASADS